MAKIVNNHYCFIDMKVCGGMCVPVFYS